MTYSDCFITIDGIEDHRDERNPAPFRQILPATPGQYWVPAVERFAAANNLKVRYVLDNLTPEIVVTAAQLEELLLPIYGSEHEFFRRVKSVLDPRSCYTVYASEF